METAFLQGGMAAGSTALIGWAAYGVKKTYKFVKAEYGYVRDMSNNFASLEREMKDLCDKEEEVESRLNAKGKEMHLSPEGERWFKEVKTIKDEVEKLKNEYQKQSARKFLLGVYPTPESVNLGKRIVKKTNQVVYLKNQINEITIMVEMTPTSILGKMEKFLRNYFNG